MTYKVIQQYGEKWLRAINPFDENGQAWRGFKSSNPDIPYIGTRPEGTVLDESEVTAITQARHKDYTGSDWFNVYDNGNWDYYQTRTVYTDAEPHDHDISDDYWRKRCEAAERFIAKSPCDNDITPAQEAAYDAWQEIVKEESK